MSTRETFAFCCLCGDKFWIKETCKYCDNLIHDNCEKCSGSSCGDCEYELDMAYQNLQGYISDEEFKKRVRRNV
jgi:hypothetical protein